MKLFRRLIPIAWRKVLPKQFVVALFTNMKNMPLLNCKKERQENELVRKMLLLSDGFSIQ